ncbi:MAG: sulfatase-like hydrolase/transferase [Bryobacterales bacterium]|nr:sulfatase-like hydrolase/transferase [Bryobacterales bacterium]
MASLSRRSLLMGAGAAPLVAQKRGPAPAADRPNILLIVADDLAAWMLGCYGNREIRTPNIDRLAQGGVRFLNNYVVTPVCSASRATLFTGRLPNQHGIHDFLTPRPIENPPQGQKEAPAGFAQETMISDVLSQNGYQCGYVGKWHMGNDTNPGHGYRYTYTFDGGSSPYQDPVMYLNGKQVKESGYLTELTTQHAVQYLDRLEAGKPFFLTASYFNPHTPYSGHPQKYYDMYANVNFDTVGWKPAAPNALREKELLKDPVGNLRKCAASVSALDDQIPALIKHLTAKKLLMNTLVIFTGDNGFLLGRHGLWSKGLASDPINMYEEVMQVPMIWNWPGKIPVEATRPELVSFYDFFPSVLDVAGVPLPAGKRYVGKSYLPLATNKPLGKKETWPGTVFGYFRNTEMARDRYYKIVVRNGGSGPNELFDLRTDTHEMVNRYDDPQYVNVRDRLLNELAAWRRRSA